MCVCCTTVSCALRWGETLVGDFHYWAFSPRCGTRLLGVGPVQAADPHMGPHMGRELDTTLFCFIFVLYYIRVEPKHAHLLGIKGTIKRL